MPTDAELRKLPPTPDHEISAAADNDDDFKLSRTRRACFWSQRGAEAGTKVNGLGGLFLGHSALGNEMWASLTIRHNECLCDAPHRAFLRLHNINDRRAAPDVRAVLVTGLDSMAEVVAWDMGIKGNTLETRYAFVYDVLVAETKGDSG
jgi:hypothetical protein